MFTYAKDDHKDICSHEIVHFAIMNANLILDDATTVQILSAEIPDDEHEISTLFRFRTKDGKEMDLVFKQAVELSYEEKTRLLDRVRLSLPKQILP